MRNAFNLVRRDHFLGVIASRVPDLHPFLHQAYSRPSPLFFKDTELRSSTGVQQGDPAGPAAFALAVDEIARMVASPLNVWYLDDATIGGPVESVVSDLTRIISRLEAIGLSLITGKCEVLTSRLGTPDLTPSCQMSNRSAPIRHIS